MWNRVRRLVAANGGTTTTTEARHTRLRPGRLQGGQEQSMRNGLLGTIAVWACGAGLAIAQPLPPAALPGPAAPGAAMAPGGMPLAAGPLTPFGGGPGAAP